MIIFGYFYKIFSIWTIEEKNLIIRANFIENVNIAHLSILHLSSVQVLQEILH